MLNGGIGSLDEAEAHLRHVSGVMLGRAAYHDPLLLEPVDRRFFAAPREAFELAALIQEMADYAERQLSVGVRLNQITRHMLGLANGIAGARQFRQILSVDAARRGAGPEVLFRALDAVEPRAVAAE
jgi:tRNA-dihydrouridine synthase A